MTRRTPASTTHALLHALRVSREHLFSFHLPRLLRIPESALTKCVPRLVFHTQCTDVHGYGHIVPDTRQLLDHS